MNRLSQREATRAGGSQTGRRASAMRPGSTARRAGPFPAATASSLVFTSSGRAAWPDFWLSMEGPQYPGSIPAAGTSKSRRIRYQAVKLTPWQPRTPRQCAGRSAARGPGSSASRGPRPSGASHRRGRPRSRVF